MKNFFVGKVAKTTTRREEVKKMCSTKELADRLIKENDGKLLANKQTIIALTGIGRTKLDRILSQIVPVGGRTTYFLPDVAEELRKY